MVGVGSDYQNALVETEIGEMSQIIYRKIKIESHPVRVVYSEKWTPIKLQQGSPTIEEFVADPAQHANAGEPLDEDKILDIPIREPSYVVIELDPQDGLRFNPNRAGITLGKYFAGDEDLAGKLYSSPKYVGVTGMIAEEPMEGCRMLFFPTVPFSKHRPDVTSYNQPLNFHVIDAAGTPLTIDPDVRYPGNGGN